MEKQAAEVETIGRRSSDGGGQRALTSESLEKMQLGRNSV